MESNRDEADKCLELAMKYIRQGNKDKAERFVRKAEKLFPSKRIQEALNLVARMGKEEEVRNEEEEGVRERRERSKGGEDHDNGEASTSSAPKNFTQDQVEAVKRVRRCKNYYEILGVAKDCTENDLKKAYRKLALAFHPDKNKAPGASEAFKVIGNAYAVLSDEGKKRQYDLYGSDEDQAARSSGRRSQRGGFHEYEDPSHGFQGDMTAEEIFNMFFGGGMPGSSVYVRRGGRWHRQAGNVGEQQGQQGQGHAHGHQDQGSFSAIFQLLPILLLVLVSLLSSLLVSDPLYSLEPSHKFHVQRKTANMGVSFYVKDSFRTDYTGSLRKLERQIEEEYIQHLRNNCFREKSYKENLLWQARYSGNNHLLNKAHSYPTPSCGSLEKIYASAG